MSTPRNDKVHEKNIHFMHMGFYGSSKPGGKKGEDEEGEERTLTAVAVPRLVVALLSHRAERSEGPHVGA
jgi:hypothetical protein